MKVKKLIKKVLLQQKKQQDRNKQIQYHKNILKSDASTKKQLASYYRLLQLGRLDDHLNIKQSKDDKPVMPGIGDMGHQLKRQGGLAKAIFPFNGPKCRNPK